VGKGVINRRRPCDGGFERYLDVSEEDNKNTAGKTTYNCQIPLKGDEKQKKHEEK
jgi:hypothetical protein